MQNFVFLTDDLIDFAVMLFLTASFIIAVIVIGAAVTRYCEASDTKRLGGKDKW